LRSLIDREFHLNSLQDVLRFPLKVFPKKGNGGYVSVRAHLPTGQDLFKFKATNPEGSQSRRRSVSRVSLSSSSSTSSSHSVRQLSAKCEFIECKLPICSNLETFKITENGCCYQCVPNMEDPDKIARTGCHYDDAGAGYNIGDRIGSMVCSENGRLVQSED